MLVSRFYFLVGMIVVEMIGIVREVGVDEGRGRIGMIPLTWSFGVNGRDLVVAGSGVSMFKKTNYVS